MIDKYTFVSLRRRSATKVCAFFRIMLLLGALGTAQNVFAFSFVPTAAEFQAWPLHCKAIYVGAMPDESAQFAHSVPSAAVKKWMKFAKEHGGAWHYCAGIVQLNRARVEADPKKREYAYERAAAQAAFSYARTSPDKPFRAKMATIMAMAYRGLGKYEIATKILETSISEHPSYPDAYTALALIHRDANHKEQERDILLKGNEATGGKSAEIHYFLGLVYLDMEDIPAASKHAKEAYRLGYPLRGLMSKLKRLDGSSKH